MTANTVYDIFMALPDTERHNLIVLVNEYKQKEESKLSVKLKNQKRELTYSKQDAMDYLLKNVFTSKK